MTEFFATGNPKQLVTHSIGVTGELRLCDGTYYVMVRVDAPNVTVESLNGAETTILDGAGVGRLIVNDTEDGVFRVGGLTIANSSGGYGGGVVSESDIEVSDCVLRDNQTSNNGAALYSYDGAISIVDSVISGNQAMDGGAVASSEGDAEIEGCTFSDNLSYRGGGAIHLGDGGLIVTDSVFSGNNSSDSGGAVYVYQRSADIAGSEFSDNQSGGQGGAVFIGGGYLQMTDTLVSYNSASSHGGGVYVGGGDIDLVDSLFTNNRGNWGGGAIAVDGSVSCVRTKKATAGFQNNLGDEGSGGGVFAEITVTSTDCDWGDGATDNRYEDISVWGYVANYGSNASFTCSQKACW